MAKRAANGRGAVRQRTDGRWEARLSYRDSATGERKRVSVYGATQKLALAELDKVQDRLEAGKPPRDATSTLSAWLVHWRATTLAAGDRKAATKELYANLSRKHLESGPLGAVRLDRLKPSDIEGLVLSMRAATKPGKPTQEHPNPEPVRALSDSTIRQTFTILRQALDGAVRDGLLARNPCHLVKRPGVRRIEAKYLDTSAVSALLVAADGLRYAPVLKLIASTGLRRGEALALRWADVDLDDGVLLVRGTLSRVNGKLAITVPKSERSRREIPLAPPVVAMLEAHRKTQLEERLRAANVWQDTGLVFTSELGTPVEPSSVLRDIKLASAEAGLEGVGVHTLRHSAAVAWLEGGTHIRQVADLLGHSSISITGDVYGHGSHDGARAAVVALGVQLSL
ncbi:integrase [Mycobacterium sp. 852002-51971_SCH5477799-a]|uniref:tyrosine-type recombinase/integrase n=1 Tax=Mycobacterium sp. 852002-51971_SCH5477799-a TaxID=1834106 RepID=UPI0007FCF8EA|nr:site-specific integrase [Mycobacterium sp. 852002-51971_SCH5477799-a]OBF65919.1 integrase [Mycobacterium sp. 852002-51971_SCH5477799-a]